MNIKSFVPLLAALTLLVSGYSQAGEPIGTAKARGDYGSFEAQSDYSGAATRSRPVYRYSTPQTSSAIVTEQPSEAVVQAPAEARRFSQAPQEQAGATTKDQAPLTATQPCPGNASVAAQPSNARRYSYAPAPQYSGSTVRAYSGYAGQNSRPTWELPKTAPGKFNVR